MREQDEFSTLSAAERREVIIAELKRKSRIRTLLRGLPLDEVHIPADHEHQFRFNVNTISGPM